MPRTLEVTTLDCGEGVRSSRRSPEDAQQWRKRLVASLGAHCIRFFLNGDIKKAMMGFLHYVTLHVEACTSGFETLISGSARIFSCAPLFLVLLAVTETELFFAWMQSATPVTRTPQGGIPFETMLPDVSVHDARVLHLLNLFVFGVISSLAASKRLLGDENCCTA